MEIIGRRHHQDQGSVKIARKEDSSVVPCFLSVLKKKIFIREAAACHLTLPQGKHKLLLPSFTSTGVKLKP